MLGAQLIAVMLYPALDDTAGGRAALGVFGMAVLGLALWVGRYRGRSAEVLEVPAESTAAAAG